MKTQKTQRAERRKLKNAPLVEVIFEVRWRLHGAPNVPPAFYTDPGYTLLYDRFARFATRKGFGEVEKTVTSPVPAVIPGHQILARFRRSSTMRFPIWQIGQGIYAANETAASYEWSKFRRLALDGLSAVVDGYPSAATFSLEVERAELKYRNVFSPPIASSNNFIEFINNDTRLQIKLDAFLTKLKVSDRPNARFTYEVPLRKPPRSLFAVTLGTSMTDARPSMMMETTFITLGPMPNKGKKGKYIKRSVGEILDAGHELCSSFFEKSLADNLMSNLKGG
jgi:uncharacterized protein (TIGR04255 family)